MDMNNTAYNNWTTETGDRLQIASVSFLLIGSIAFVLVICLILFEDGWVAKIVSKFPKEEDNFNEGTPEAEVEIDLKITMSHNSIEDQEGQGDEYIWL